MLPKIPEKLAGTVQPQFVRCGKANCRCANGELHGPYFYRFWRDSYGRLRKQYVRKADVEAVRTACQAAQEDTRRARTVLLQGRAALDWLVRDGPVSLRTPLELERLLSHPVNLWALLDLAEDLEVDIRFRLRAMRSLVKWQESDRSWISKVAGPG